MEIEEAVREVLALPPSEIGQETLHAFHLASLYFAGAPEVSLSPRLHPRAHHVIEFARNHSKKDLDWPSGTTRKSMESLVADFPGFKSIQAVDDLVTNYVIGMHEVLVRPECYDKYFSPSAEFLWLGLYALSWYFALPSMFTRTARNRALVKELGKKGTILEPYVGANELFFAEVARRCFPRTRAVRTHASETRRLAKYSKKPRSRFDGEARRAIECIFMLDGVRLDAETQLKIFSPPENPINSDADVYDEVQKMRSLASKYRRRIVPARQSGEIMMLHRSSLFLFMVDAGLLSDNFQHQIYLNAR